jgi:hypothetical protein
MPRSRTTSHIVALLLLLAGLLLLKKPVFGEPIEPPAARVAEHTIIAAPIVINRVASDARIDMTVTKPNAIQ